MFICWWLNVICKRLLFISNYYWLLQEVDSIARLVQIQSAHNSLKRCLLPNVLLDRISLINDGICLWILIRKQLLLKTRYCNIEFVYEFKLLDITVDHNFLFNNYVDRLKSFVNKKLYFIKKLFNLSLNIKVQLFKTFIQPHFYHCSYLSVYFNNRE